jgi:hypothetical protein
MTQQIAVFAVYETRASVETAADTLVSEGFTSSDLSVLLPERNAETASSGAPASTAPNHLFGGTIGILAGLSMLAVPGLGPLVGEGTLKAGLAGLGMKKAVGDVANSLINMGVPELEAKRYEDRLQQRAILLAVRCPSLLEAKRATEIIKRTGGEDACTVAQSSSGASSDPTVATKSARGSD